MGFHLHVDISDVAKKLNQTEELVGGKIAPFMQQLSVGARDIVLQTANSQLQGYQRETYLGKDSKNVRWMQVGEGMWVVELDPSAQWLEEGRPRVFMDWLLKNAKTAKDGSKYKAIPMPQEKGAGKEAGWNPNKPALATLTKKILKDNKLNLRNIERDEGGKPLVGVLHNIPVGKYEAKAQLSPNRSDYFSKPRSWEDSQNTGLPMHSGIFMLEGLMVVQRPNPKTKHGVTREAITYRVISSKHEQEGRWFYPEVKPLNAMQQAYDWAKGELDVFMKELDKSFQDINNGN